MSSPNTPAATKWGSLRPYAIATLLYSAAAVVYTWPVFPNMRSGVAGWAGDNLYFVWVIDWVRRCFFELHRSPLWVPIVNYPEGASLACTEMTPFMTLTGVPFAFVGGAVFGYNCSFLLSFVLSGLTMFHWVRRMTGSTRGALVAGFAYGFSAYRIAHAAGHLNLLGTMWLPVFFMVVMGLVDARNRWWRNSLYLAGAMALNALVTPYYFYMTLVVGAVFAVVYTAATDRHQFRERQYWVKMTVSLAACVGAAAVCLWPYIGLSAEGIVGARDLEQTRRWCACPQDYILPAQQHLVWGLRFVMRWRDNIEHVLYLGVVSMALAGVGLVWGRLAGVRRAIGVAFAITALCAVVLSFGPNFHWYWRPLRIPVPHSLQSLLRHDTLLVHLPGRLLYEFVPFYSVMRCWVRYGLYTQMLVSALAGVGTAVLCVAYRSHRDLVAILALLAVALDTIPGPSTITRVQERAVDQWLATQPDGPMAEFPASLLEHPRHLLDSGVAHKPTIGGYFGFLPPQFRRSICVLNIFPLRSCVRMLRDLGVRYVVVDSRAYVDFPGVHRLMLEHGLKPMNIVGRYHVYDPGSDAGTSATAPADAASGP